MKVLIFLLTFCFLLSEITPQNSAIQFECSLAAELFPLEYSFVTRSVSMRIRFTSNCLRMRDFTFEGFFSFGRRIERARHPTTVTLSIFRNNYTIRYSQRTTVQSSSIMRRFQYGRASVAPGQNGVAVGVDILQDNRVVLLERVPNTYNINNLRKLLRRRNPRACRIDKSLRIMNCRV